MIVSTEGKVEYDNNLRQKYYDLIDYGNTHPREQQQNLQSLRQLVLLEGLPSESEDEAANRLAGNAQCGLRGLIWKIFLNVKNVDAEKYISLVQKGKPKHETYQQIRKDVTRTFMSDNNFVNSVSPETLSRCLSAVSHHCAETSGNLSKVSYVQGMNVLCGAFLYVLPEVDAFFAFLSFIADNYLYVVPGIPGVYTGVALLDKILSFVDPELHKHLLSHPPYSPHLLMQFVLSLGTCTPPLDEVLHLWDFYFAFGTHMNIVCTVAQLILMRDTLLAHPTPATQFRALPTLHAQSIISLAVQLVRQLPSNLYDMLVQHPATPIQIPK